MNASGSTFLLVMVVLNSSGQLSLALVMQSSGHEPVEALAHVVLDFMCLQSNLKFPLYAKFLLKPGVRQKDNRF